MASRRILLQLAAPCLRTTRSHARSFVSCLSGLQRLQGNPRLRVAAGFHSSHGRLNEHIINIQDEEDFKTRVLDSTPPVIVDFHADWCGPCKMLGPRLEALVATKQGKVIMAKVDIDENADLAIFHGVEAVPTVLAVKNGKTVDKFVGMKDEKDLEKFVDKLTGD